MPSADERVEPRADVPLAPLTTLGVGGRARWFVRAGDVRAIAAAHVWAAGRGLPLLVLGGGSNVVVSDAGFDGLVVQMAVRGVTFEGTGDVTRMRVGAGEPWDPVVAEAVRRGLAGIECLAGIPGLTGGTPIQNVGAYGQEVAGTIEEVLVYDRRTGAETTLPAAACLFGYRTSRFKHQEPDGFVVCAVTFRLQRGQPTVAYPELAAALHDAGASAPSLEEVRQAVLRIRRRKGMVLDAGDPDTRSVGSFFTNPRLPVSEYDRLVSVAGEPPPTFPAGAGELKVPAAWLIERAGFHTGWAAGAAGLSTKHPLALVNRGGACAQDIVRLAARIARAVEDRFGVRLSAEPVFVGFGDDPDLRVLGVQGPVRSETRTAQAHVHAPD